MDNIKCVKCEQFPIYNNPGEEKPLYCNDHKSNSMINVKNIKCLKCEKLLTCNEDGKKKLLYYHS